MTPDTLDDPMLTRLAALSSPLPDPARAARVRARCCTQLARNRRRSERLVALAGSARHVMAPVALALLCGACLVDMVGIALRTFTS